ncbi:MAG TPA: curli assembly protein CsgF [Burkholderiales bacterium]
MFSRAVVAVALVFAFSIACRAGGLVYTPINPAFGGNPNNGVFLLNEAAAQNNKTNPNASSPTGFQQLTPLQQFNQSLQSAILNRVASAITGGVVDANGNLKPGIIQTTSFTITILDLGNGLIQITTIDKATGQSTQFQVSQ